MLDVIILNGKGMTMTSKLSFLKIMPMFVALILLSGCGHRKRSMLNKLSLRMNKDEVQKELGEPDEIICPIINKKNEKVDYWIYSLSTFDLGQHYKRLGAVLPFCFIYPLYPLGGAIEAYMDSAHKYHDYYLKFVNDFLMKWGIRKDLLIRKETP